MQVTDEELEAVALAVHKAQGFSTPLSPPGSPWRNYEKEVARAAIIVYNATPGQVRMREDAARWRVARLGGIIIDTGRNPSLSIIYRGEQADARADAALAAEDKP